jgi:benzoylformate decarboxylase
MTGIEIFLEMLARFGVTHLFGNPGTSELPLHDALVDDPRLRYILGLQEVPVMSMADGYAMASGQLAVVNVHISCGLGNGMGILYNAYREGTPLLVTAGQQDRRLIFREPILYGDMVAVAKPWTKWAYEVQRVADLPAAMQRAIQTALTPPTGPVFLSLPMDLQMETTTLGPQDLRRPTVLDTRIRPPLAAISRAAQALATAERPAILAGSRVTQRGAIAELVAVAERLGAPVYAEPGTTHGRLSFPCDHPLYAQGLPLWSPEIRELLHQFDTILVVGMDLFRQYVHHEPVEAIPAHVRLVHLDEEPWQLGKNYTVEFPLWGDTKAGLGELDGELARYMTDEQALTATARAHEIAATHRRQREALQAKIAGERDTRPLTPLTMMHAIARVLPANVAVIEEAVTTTNTTLERLGALQNTTGYFGHRGWTLGWGLGCTLGAQLAWPDRPVLGILGEGAACYGIQGLWSAAHYKIPATFVICNNAQYQILKIGARGLGLKHAEAEQLVGLDLVQPEVDLVAMSRAWGVPAVRIDDPDALSDALQAAFTSATPLLIDVPIQRKTPPRLEYG